MMLLATDDSWLITSFIGTPACPAMRQAAAQYSFLFETYFINDGVMRASCPTPDNRYKLP
jgi:hypothetical protein